MAAVSRASWRRLDAGGHLLARLRIGRARITRPSRKGRINAILA
jgi:hypothetical protein